jgi:hypothetical protein
MTAKVFICWSGQRGLRIAEALQAWLGEIFTNDVLTAHVSSGIEKGVPWQGALQYELDQAHIGILCLTPEALRSPWISYEAGMLVRCLSTPNTNGMAGALHLQANRRLFTFLIGVKSSELEGPLAAFQSTDGQDSADTNRLLQALFGTLPAGKARHELSEKLFGPWPELWNALTQRLAVIPSALLTDVWPGFADLFRRKTFDEPTAACVSQHWLARYDGVRGTIATLVERRTLVERACRKYVLELLRDLELELDKYGTATAELIGRRFTIAPNGMLNIDPPGLEVASEERRARVRRLVARISDPSQAPFFDEAAHFDRLESFTERESLVHRMIPMVEELADLVHARSSLKTSMCVTSEALEHWPEPAACFKLTLAALRADRRPVEVPNARKVNVEVQFRTTNWDFDRIMYSAYLKRRLACGDGCAVFRESVVEFAEGAVERARIIESHPEGSFSANKRPAQVGSASTLQVWFALQAIDALKRSDLSAELCQRIEKLANDTLTFVRGLGTPHDLLREYADDIRQRYATRTGIASSTTNVSSQQDPTIVF